MKRPSVNRALCALAVLFAVGCGSPDYRSVCSQLCDKQYQCNTGNLSASNDGCRANCNTTNSYSGLGPDGVAPCKNSGDIVSCQNDCLNQQCDALQVCLAKCPQCHV